jgi:hypothetical protein
VSAPLKKADLLAVARYLIGHLSYSQVASVAVCTLKSEALAVGLGNRTLEGLAIVGTMHTESVVSHLEGRATSEADLVLSQSEYRPPWGATE